MGKPTILGRSSFQRALSLFLFVVFLPNTAHSQDTSESAEITVPLIVPAEAPLRVELEKKVPVKRAGQPVRARVVAPVYSFDRVVIPAGSEVLGRIARIQGVSKGRRVRAALNADFSPPRAVELEFDTLVLPDGQQRPIETSVTRGAAQVVHLVSPAAKKSRERAALEQAKQQAKKRVDATIQEIKAPGKLHRLKEFLLAELPYRPQSLGAGTLYEAELKKPLDFGAEPLPTGELAAPGTLPQRDSEVGARLLTPLDSATARRDAPVEAVVTEPLFSADRKLILPEGSRIQGRVIQARRARRFHHNGQLRLLFDRIEWPSGITRPEEASLDSVDVAGNAHLTLDSESGTRAADSKTRYLRTGLSLAVAAVSSFPDVEHGGVDSSGDAGTRGAAGGSGFRFVGLVAGFTVPSRAAGMAMGAYGAGKSVYRNFFANGTDVVFPRDTPMEIGFGLPDP